METIPQELVRAIVDQIDDQKSLKMCSLVATMFRDHSQRILLYSLTLGDDDKPYTAAWILLQESPHIARHFRRLNCLLPEEDKTLEQVDALCAVLSNLWSVRHCYLVGATDDPRLWPSIPPQLSLAIVEFIQRQELAQLHVFAIHALPRTVLALFLGSASSLSIVEGSVDLTAPPVEYQTVRPIAENLVLAFCPEVARVLSSREFAPQMANIRKLWWEPELEFSDRLVLVVASNLEHIRMQYEEEASRSFNHFLPPLPCLKLAEMTLDFDNCDGSWLIARLSSILNAAPQSLQEISVICSPSDALERETLGEMDCKLADSPAAPRIRWRVDMDDDPEVAYNDFRTSLMEGMPKMLAQGKLTVEKCSVVDEGFSDWAMKR
ncbi:hypothetical protein B0H19DRAFT_1193020 [Mycena capillaripes]|nr:hypothetical protein B0H19DRAFT_1193020 [Mycena capillaripes]